MVVFVDRKSSDFIVHCDLIVFFVAMSGYFVK